MVDDNIESNGKGYNVYYSSTKDLRIAPYKIIGEIWTKKALEDPNIRDRIVSDTMHALNGLNVVPSSQDEALGVNFYGQTKTGKMFIDDLIQRGYDGIEDVYGRDVAKDPLIIFNPDNNLYKERYTKYRAK